MAIAAGEWERVVELIVERREQLEAAFATPPETPRQLQKLRELAERVLASDRELVALALEARERTVAELKKLGAGRRATHAYRYDSA